MINVFFFNFHPETEKINRIVIIMITLRSGGAATSYHSLLFKKTKRLIKDVN